MDQKVRIEIEVAADGRLFITLWRGSRKDAAYAACTAAQALKRQLPEAIAEAMAFAQESAAFGSTVTV